MAQGSARTQRLNQLESLIQLDYNKLAVFEEDLVITPGAPQKFELRQRIAGEILPTLRQHETEYGKLLSETPVVLPAHEAQTLLDEVSKAATSLEGKFAPNSEVSGALSDLKTELSKPGTASAKLKLTLPIIPLIASYEVTFETAGLMRQAWRNVKAAIAKAAPNPS